MNLLRPRFSFYNRPNALDGNAIFLGNRLQVGALFSTFTNLFHFVCGKFGGVVFGSPHSAFWPLSQPLRITFRLASFCVPVFHIVQVRSKKKVGRVHARRGVASVKNLKANRNVAFEDEPRKSVGTEIGTFEVKASVAGGEFPSNPEPALLRFGLSCVFPKAFNVALGWIDLARGLGKDFGRFTHSSIMFGFSEGLSLIATGLCALIMCGCASVVKELKRPPFPMAVLHHTRAIGIEANVPNQAGDSVFKLRLGFFSDSWAMIPAATNDLHMPAISDQFRLGYSFTDTTITEDLQTGWRGQPPPPRYQLFKPHPPELPIEPMHSSVLQRQAQETVTISRQRYDSLIGSEALRQKLQSPKQHD
jgi:hypothetical protein